MANTPTREHRELAFMARFPSVAAYLGPFDIDWLVSGVEHDPSYGPLTRAAQAICDAEQRGFDRGREAGAAPFAALFEAGYVLDTTMPTEADGYVTRSLHVGLKTGRGGTWLDAARDLCAKLGLDLAKGGE